MRYLPFQQTHRNYQFVHSISAAGEHYYRLKIVDYVQQFSYSDVVSLHQLCELTLKVLPNPSFGSFELLLEVEEGAAHRILITNAVKKIDLEQMIEVVSGEYKRYDFDLSKWPPGMYAVSVIGEEKVKTELLSLER